MQPICSPCNRLKRIHASWAECIVCFFLFLLRNGSCVGGEGCYERVSFLSLDRCLAFRVCVCWGVWGGGDYGRWRGNAPDCSCWFAGCQKEKCCKQRNTPAVNVREKPNQHLCQVAEVEKPDLRRPLYRHTFQRVKCQSCTLEISCFRKWEVKLGSWLQSNNRHFCLWKQGKCTETLGGEAGVPVEGRSGWKNVDALILTEQGWIFMICPLQSPTDPAYTISSVYDSRAATLKDEDSCIDNEVPASLGWAAPANSPSSVHAAPLKQKQNGQKHKRDRTPQ